MLLRNMNDYKYKTYVIDSQTHPSFEIKISGMEEILFVCLQVPYDVNSTTIENLCNKVEKKSDI